MTQVTSNAFTVQVVSTGAGWYADMGVGETRNIWVGQNYNYGQFTTEPPPSILAYSTSWVDTNRNKLIVGAGSGGHGDFGSNEIWELDLQLQTWTQITPRFLYSVSQLSEALADADNTSRPGAYVTHTGPISRHTFYSGTFSPTQNKLFVGGSSTWSGGYGSGDLLWKVWPGTTADFWSWTPGLGESGWQWLQSALLSPETIPAPEQMTYSLTRDRIYAMVKRKYTNYDPTVFSASAVSIPTAYTTVNLTPRIWECDPATNSWSAHPNTMPATSYGLICVDTVNDRLVLMNNENPTRRVWVCPLATKVWNEVTVLSGEAPALRNDEGDRTQFSTVTGRVLYVSAAVRALFALTINAGGTSGVWERVNADETYSDGGSSLRQAHHAVWDERNKILIVPRQSHALTQLQVFCTRA